jgi:hypothetical protein
MTLDRLTASILEFDTPNKNGRMYPRAVAEAIVQQFTERVRDGAVLGHLGIEQGNALHLDRVSHSITAMSIKGKEVIAEVDLLRTPRGEELLKLIQAGMLEDGSLGFRPTGTGTVAEDGTISYYRFTSIDAVIDPA